MYKSGRCSLQSNAAILLQSHDGGTCFTSQEISQLTFEENRLRWGNHCLQWRHTNISYVKNDTPTPSLGYF